MSEPGGRDVVRAGRWVPAAVPGLLMLVLGLVGSARPVLSWDEIATADVAHRSVPQIWHLVHHIDGVFGPYYLAVHLWTRVFGDSVLSLRLPSIIAMAVAAASTGELGRRLFGRTAGVVAGLLLCALPNMSRYAAEARPYALACMFSILALLLLYRALDRPGPGRWVAYGAAVAGLSLCSLIALTTLAGHLAILLIRNRRTALPWCAATAGALVVAAPLIWWGLHQRQAQLHWVPPVTLGAVYAFPARLAGSPQTAWLLIGVLLLAAFRPARPLVEMAAAALLPMVVLGAVSLAGPSFWVDRYLLFVLLPAVIVAAAALPRSGPVRLAVLAAMVVAALPGQIAVRAPAAKNGSDYRTLAAAVARLQLPGDGIVFQKGRTMRAGVGYYLRHDRGRPRDLLVRRSAARTATLKASEYADPAARLPAADRIWLIVYGRRADPATVRPDLARVLHDDFRQAAVWTVKNGTMALYIRRSAWPGPSRTP